ncbi:hypothetical protein [Kordia jejudonensis]|uniref:hypothetical protein n=1 Tax=Kordia jejudonensis TaxID=1348245 RepID=UPI00069A3453|nr:hypothetical protein [Kordia jejudonensis]
MKLQTTILFLFFGIFLGIAQKGQNKEKIKKLKIAYFTENLDFTEKEAQLFWPVYNTFDDKNFELRERLNTIKKELKYMDDMSDAEASKVLDRIQVIEKQVYENKVNLTKKLRAFLPARKIILLKKAERDFNRKLMKEFRKRRRE